MATPSPHPPLPTRRTQHAITVCFFAITFEPLLTCSHLNRTRACAASLEIPSPGQADWVTMCMRLGPQVCQGDHELEPRRGQRGGRALRGEYGVLQAECPPLFVAEDQGEPLVFPYSCDGTPLRTKTYISEHPRWPEGEKGGCHR